ncbi:DUF3606 domain-containing protein [Caulobacter flavus]|uniref:DUF3606 domain-containing protein n=1 Tax=Caulobacter flavus TaxID=1679497 RepID=A0A2N5CP00_9CAUL|nr:DUF3606 domain-containing protein [Caulobacter flavus]AYV48601.1 DUF3606 domain-containing protein [Caulobacter flavus]PLR08683.1 DUF3606 domain-containing protein [Caulobacter flavus]
MCDSIDFSGAGDRARIKANEPMEVRYWTERFNVPEEVLLKAIQLVGADAEAVQAHLKSSSAGGG